MANMIFPLDNSPKEVNKALIRIASQNNKDIELMQQQVKELNAKQKNLQERFQSQVDRWQNYREAYNATTNMFSLLNGTMSYDDFVKTMPGYDG